MIHATMTAALVRAVARSIGGRPELERTTGNPRSGRTRLRARADRRQRIRRVRPTLRRPRSGSGRCAARTHRRGKRVDLQVLTDACWTVDQATRLGILSARLLEAGEAPDPRADRSDRTLNRAAHEHHAYAMRQVALDPVTTELVRRRCAHHHAC